MLVSGESTDRFDSSTLAFDCSNEEFQINRGVTIPSIAQNDSRRTAENSATHKRTERFRSMARDREEIAIRGTCHTKNQHMQH